MSEYVNYIDTLVYAARVNDSVLLNKSSSGGMFIPLSDYILDMGGAVACAVYNYQTSQTEFKLVTNKSDRDKALGSKYMQSIPGDIFAECEKWLKSNEGKKLLFVGMGCQADGFRSYAEIKGFRERVYIVDIVCHGSPSPKLWREYASALEEKHGGKIDYLTFKDKRNGWKTPYAMVRINGKEIPVSDYVRVFYSKCALRPSCHVCPYTTTERKTDMTIGDFWGIENVHPEFFDPKGNSLVLIHTSAGKKLFDNIKDLLEYIESNRENCLQPNLVRPTELSTRRGEFWNDYNNNNVQFIMKKYGTISMTSKVKRKLKKVIKSILK